MPEIFGIKYNEPELLSLVFVKREGIQWNDTDFEYRSYWEGDFNHYERLFWLDEPFTGIEYELYPNGVLWGYSIYVDGYNDVYDNVEFYPSGEKKNYSTYIKDEKRALLFEWHENGQLKLLRQATNHGLNYREVRFDEKGKIISQKSR